MQELRAPPNTGAVCWLDAARLFAELGDVPFFIARAERRPSVYELPPPDLER